MPTTYTEISSVVLTSSAPNVRFGNIPQIYTDLVLHYDFTSASPGDFAMTYNDDLLANYHRGYGFSNVTAGNDSSGFNSPISIGILNAYNNGAPASGVCNIMEYTNPNIYKTAITEANINGSSSFVGLYLGVWYSLAPITSIRFAPFADVGATNTFSSGSKFTLYGIKGA
jgi:hypothetical protein